VSRSIGKRAVITGAASGIGAAIVERFKLEGYNTYGVDIQDVLYHGIRTDVSKGLFRVPHHVDTLVVSHGVSGVGRTWEEVLNVNVIGVKNAVESCLPAMLKGGSIVLIASMTGSVVGNKDMEIANYAASKGAVVGYMRQLAVELASSGIRVNCVSPGPVVTPMTDNLKNRDRTFYDEFFGRCILQGYTMPDDVADAVAYVAQARRMTGHNLVIDGGYTTW